MYTYKGYTIVISRNSADVLAYKSGKLVFKASTEPDIESMIDSITL